MGQIICMFDAESVLGLGSMMPAAASAADISVTVTDG